MPGFATLVSGGLLTVSAILLVSVVHAYPVVDFARDDGGHITPANKGLAWSKSSAAVAVPLLVLVSAVTVTRVIKQLSRKEAERRRLRRRCIVVAAVETEVCAARIRLAAEVALAARFVGDRRVKQVRRPKTRRPNYNDVWWRLLHDARSANPNSRQGKKFRRRFRVPPGEVRRLVTLVRESGKWSSAPDATGAEACPVELLVMGCLQILGRAVCFDLASEGACCSEVWALKCKCCIVTPDVPVVAHARPSLLAM